MNVYARASHFTPLSVLSLSRSSSRWLLTPPLPSLQTHCKIKTWCTRRILRLVFKTCRTCWLFSELDQARKARLLRILSQEEIPNHEGSCWAVFHRRGGSPQLVYRDFKTFSWSALMQSTKSPTLETAMFRVSAFVQLAFLYHPHPHAPLPQPCRSLPGACRVAGLNFGRCYWMLGMRKKSGANGVFSPQGSFFVIKVVGGLGICSGGWGNVETQGVRVSKS